ncbi:MAG: C25 family cysteine peptidase [Candidatus Tenebribacter davisii]|nr:C25 family cysteine peptidase [Candidatus Tenebribacter davisii]
MKKTTLLIFVMFALASLAFASEVIKYNDNWASAGFSLEQRNGSGVQVNYSISEFSLNDIRVNGEDMVNILLPDVLLQNDEGAPNLAGGGRLIALPQGAYAKLNIISKRTEIFSNVEVAPAPRIPLDTDDTPLEFNRNKSIYSKNEFYPASPVTLGEKTQMRGVDVVMLGITPFQYNPVTKELLVYRDLQVEVEFMGGNGHFGADNLRSRWWDPILNDSILNHESLPVIDYTTRNRTRDGADYLIICPDDATFLAWADSIKVFRSMQGISTVIKTTAEVGGNNATAIEAYINDIMNPSTGWDPAPSAVLLMGDYGTTGNTVVSPIWDNYCASDNIYADVSGNSMPDVILARMTAQNETHLETMVTKFINYERNPPTNPDFYDHPITALGWQTDRWFQICSEAVGGYFLHEQGKNPVRINAVNSGTPGTTWSTATNTSVVVNKFGPSDLGYIPATPVELGGWTGGTATMVNNAINDGAFLLQHRDHGGETGWGEPNYNSTSINGLTNTDLTFIFSINCLTGKYNMSGECFAEKFHRYQYNGVNSGALGIIAASEVSYSFVNDTYVWGMFDNMWPDFLPTYGTTPDSRDVLPAFGNAAGKYFLQQSAWPYNTWDKEVTYNLFHHHGDAFTTIYSEVPQDLTVSHNPVLLSGLPTFDVSADEGSFIALSVNGEVIGVAEGTGSPVSVVIEPQIPPTIVDLVITKQNHYRYHVTIPVIPPDGPYVVFDSYVIDDAAGNNNGSLDYGETIDLDMIVNNVGSSQATNVDITITSADPYITIIDGTENFGNVDTGTLVTVEDAFQIEVTNDVPNGHVIDFTVTSIGEETWLSYFSIDALAPNVEFLEFLVDDTASGNGDYMWDPGETVDINVTLENNGASDAFDIYGILSSVDPYVTINTPTAQAFGDITFSNTSEVSYNVVSDEATPEAHLAEFVIDFAGGQGVSGSGNFSAQIGGYLIEEYFDSWLPIEWTTEGGSNWTQGSSSNAGGTTPEAEFYWSPSTTAVQRLVSKPVNTTGAGSLNLSFMQTVDNYNGNYTIRLETTSDGLTWNTVTTFPSSNFGPQLEEIEITTPDVGSPTFQIAWTFDGYSYNINNWYVDNVILGGGTIAVVGTVAGVVTDADSGFPIDGADIAGLAVSGADGSYTFDISVGTYDFTCSAVNYFDILIEDVIVQEDQTTTINFAMNPSFPPQNVEAEIMDYNDIVITWETPTEFLTENTTEKKTINIALENKVITRELTEQTRSLTGYTIYEDGTELTEITDPATLTYTDEALDAGNYAYTVTAVYDDGESNPSEPANVNVILPAPINVLAESQDPNIIISWEIPAERGIDSYKVYRDNAMIAEDLSISPYEDLNVPSGTYTYNVVTVYDGDWESEMSDDAVIDHTDFNSVLKPTETQLTGNYPNPFNPVTNISFSMNEPGNISINIYNMKGQLVKTLINEYLDAAYHNVVWNGKDNSSKSVSSGIYFYKMRTGNYTATKKMILMK